MSSENGTQPVTARAVIEVSSLLVGSPRFRRRLEAVVAALSRHGSLTEQEIFSIAGAQGEDDEDE